MIKVVLILFAGMLVGYLLRERKSVFKVNARLTLWMIYLLLFFLGLAIGYNEYIMHNLSILGLTGLMVTLSALAGSIFTVWLLWCFVFRGKESIYEG
jgi:uncharacterized membrane protein YbjE (DUF340 family)